MPAEKPVWIDIDGCAASGGTSTNLDSPGSVLGFSLNDCGQLSRSRKQRRVANRREYVDTSANEEHVLRARFGLHCQCAQWSERQKTCGKREVNEAEVLDALSLRVRLPLDLDSRDHSDSSSSLIRDEEVAVDSREAAGSAGIQRGRLGRCRVHEHGDSGGTHALDGADRASAKNVNDRAHASASPRGSTAAVPPVSESGCADGSLRLIRSTILQVVRSIAGLGR